MADDDDTGLGTVALTVLLIDVVDTVDIDVDVAPGVDTGTIVHVWTRDPSG